MRLLVSCSLKGVVVGHLPMLTQFRLQCIGSSRHDTVYSHIQDLQDNINAIILLRGGFQRREVVDGVCLVDYCLRDEYRKSSSI